MFTAGVVFLVLAGLNVLSLLFRYVGKFAAEKTLKYSDTPVLRHTMAKDRARLQAQLDDLNKTSVVGTQIITLVYMIIAIIFFYFQ